MNERIRELARQAENLKRDEVSYRERLHNRYCTGDMEEEIFREKFAELIVRECAKSANDWYQNHDKIHSDPMSYVLAHFGVEE